MGQELLAVRGYIRTPRKYFVATNSKGYKAIRGSADRNYGWCVIAKELSEWGSIYASWSKTEHNAKKYCTTWNNREADRYEVVKCVQVTAKEARAIKKEINLQALKQKEQVINEALTIVSEGTKEDKENN